MLTLPASFSPTVSCGIGASFQNYRRRRCALYRAHGHAFTTSKPGVFVSRSGFVLRMGTFKMTKFDKQHLAQIQADFLDPSVRPDRNALSEVSAELGIHTDQLARDIAMNVVHGEKPSADLVASFDACAHLHMALDARLIGQIPSAKSA